MVPVSRNLLRFFGLGLVVLFSLPLYGQDTDVSTRQTLRLTFAGDLMAHTINWKMKPYDKAHERLQNILKSDDLSFVNLETPIDDFAPYANYPNFNVHQDYVWPAIMAGFDVFSLANNHSYDRFSTGTRNTWLAIENLRTRAIKELTKNIWHSGLRAPTEAKDQAWRLEIMEVRGLKVGFIALTEIMNILKHDNSMYFCEFQKPLIRQVLLTWLKQADAQVDCLVVSMHSGVEYSRKESKATADLAKDLVQSGVDIVWMHHPHVLQPWYTLPGPDGEARLVMPSMGNYVSGQTWYLKANEFKQDRAWTGDSALMVLDLEFEMLAEKRIPKIVKVKPIMIGSYRALNGAVLVWPYYDLINNTRGEWKNYYAQRYQSLFNFFPGVDAKPEDYFNGIVSQN